MVRVRVRIRVRVRVRDGVGDKHRDRTGARVRDGYIGLINEAKCIENSKETVVGKASGLGLGLDKQCHPAEDEDDGEGAGEEGGGGIVPVPRCWGLGEGWEYECRHRWDTDAYGWG